MSVIKVKRLKMSWFSSGILGTALIFFMTSTEIFAQYEGKLGINLGPVHPQVWIDIVRSARAWENTGGGRLPASDMDENGWPKTDFITVLMDQRPVMEWAGTIDDPEKYRIDMSGRYKGSFQGSSLGDKCERNVAG